MARKVRRSPRRAPAKPKDPYDDYSTWDLRVAKTFFWSLILAVVVVIAGIWVSIIGILVQADLLAEIAKWPPSAIFMLIFGIIFVHLFIAVLFYILFRGGKLRLLKVLFKDRLVASKYQDFQSLRILLAFLLVFVYLFLISLVFFILPATIGQAIAQALIGWMETNIVLAIGIFMFLTIIIVFFCFVLWNHGVYWVLKRVKTIEEEREIKEKIEVEKLEKSDIETLYETYHKETGKKAVYRGKETQGFLEWKEKKGLK